MMPSLPTYPWFDQVPENLKTRNQLGELGLKPGGPIVATVEWDRGKKFAYLYEVSQAVAKRPLSAKAAATIQSQKLARRTCPVCRRVFDHKLYGSTCDDCTAYGANGLTHTVEGHFSVQDIKPHIYRVWLPVETQIGPYAAPTEERERFSRWLPYPKIEFRLMLADRQYGPLLPGHTHAWFFGRPIADLLDEWTPGEFLALAEIWPILREWAVDASLPGSQWLEWALAGLAREDAAELRFLWYEHRTTYYRDMKPYGG